MWRLRSERLVFNVTAANIKRPIPAGFDPPDMKSE